MRAFKAELKRRRAASSALSFAKVGKVGQAPAPAKKSKKT